jgi:hypothetical protein
MTNTRVKFFFTSPSERECYVYVERGKGFTEARQFPQKGNPWLKDLSPEEFAYDVKLAWPFSLEEYRRREALPMPTWDEVPGGDFYREDMPEVESEEEAPVADVLPRAFKLILDEEWERQVSQIHVLFAEKGGGEEAADAPPIPEEVRRMQQEIYASIAERGPDRTRCILNRLFENYLNGVETAPTWKDLWKECWNEPLDSRRGAEVEQSRTVRQAIHRTREILDRYFASEAGQRWPSRAVIEQNDYRISFTRRLPEEQLDGSPFIDSPFPGSGPEETEE